MAKNEFKVISVFKIITRICKKIFEFCGKRYKFLPKRCLLIICIFYLNKVELIQQVCSKIYIKNKILTQPRTKLKGKKRGAKI